MGKFTALLQLASFVVAATAGSCPSGINVVPGLDVSKYEGTWYEVASQNLGLLSACSCSRYLFSMTSNNTFDDHFTCTKSGNPRGIDLVLKGRIPDLEQPAKMEESPMYSWLPTAPYWVVEVGKAYEYAVVYACVPVAGEYIYIFHRDPHALTKKLLDVPSIQAKLTTMGINASQVKIVSHSSCDYPKTYMDESSMVI
eukprot:TRINITY_DN95535_c0_g1_i1.p1 TRINITY_DN95535_c0_g1~~TRINITY_DN95535_c0_g1_i1.p1  ORF type:complete len:198 (-),score=33.52 TRINITY_DN95535_c0_g1_i1:82-675(-)